MDDTHSMALAEVGSIDSFSKILFSISDAGQLQHLTYRLRQVLDQNCWNFLIDLDPNIWTLKLRW
jgi:hypothetical protein